MLQFSVMQIMNLLSCSFFDGRSIQDVLHMSLMYLARSVVLRLEVTNCFVIVVTTMRETFNRASCRTTFQGLLQIDKLLCCGLERPCTEMLNCSQKLLQWSMFPLNARTSNFGNLTPPASPSVDVAALAGVCISNNFFS